MKNKIEIDVYSGGSDVLLIMTGLGGTTKGYENKYEIMAKNAVKCYGVTVFVANTPNSSYEHSKENMDYIINYIDNYMKQKSINEYKIYAFGHSAGGTILAWYAYEFSNITRVLAVNPVIRFNTHNLINGCQNFTNGKIQIIVGEQDECFRFIPILNRIKNNNYSLTILPNKDHKFTGKLNEFIKLVNQLF